VKKKSRTEADKAIVASVKSEMEKPRMTESVRKALEAEAALAVRWPVADSAKA